MASLQKGRPREFCVDRALEAALHVFWTKGYEGASLTDLTEAMGITRPSLYAAFGNKEALFLSVLDLYEAKQLEYVGKALEAKTARDVAWCLLKGVIENSCGGPEPRGCLGVINSVACGTEAVSIREEVLRRGNRAKQKLVRRFERARLEGEFPDDVMPAALANYLNAVVQGISIQAECGSSREELERVAEICLQLWPAR